MDCQLGNFNAPSGSIVTLPIKKLHTHQAMKKIITVLIAILCSLNASASINPKPFTVPELTDWQGAEGSMQLSGRVVVNQKSLMPTAKAFVADCQTLLGRKLTVVDHGKAKSGDILLRQHGDKSLGTEGYRLEVGGTCVLTAATPRGAFWGTRTLLQWLEQNAALPCGKAVDVPQYRLRGFMFDVGRKYIPIDYLRQLVRILAYYKMNTLQLHLNDNGFKQYFGDDWKATSAAFRLECDTYPGLTAKDGSYTKAEFIDLQKLAESLGVEIVPEIDSPAHSLAFTHYRPSLASKEIGMDHLDIFKPEVYNFMDSLFAEYLGGREPVFRGQHVNIGTDEYDNSTQERKEQFRHYTDHYLALLQDFGKKPMLWGALTHDDGQTPVRNKGVLMCLWSNYMAEPKEMKRQGWQLVSMPDWQVYIVPLADYYHDYLPCDKLYEEWTPAHFGPVVFDEQDPQLEGGMFALSTTCTTASSLCFRP
jgi:hexosaminidase